MLTFLGAAAFLGAAFLTAGAFFSLVSFLAAVSFLGAAFLVVGFFSLASLVSFLAAASFLGAAAFLGAAGLEAFLASLVPPEGPVDGQITLNEYTWGAICYIPLGCSKAPLSTPFFNALLKSESNIFSVTLMVLLARTYFLSD